jgi:hypothetical protein
LIDILNTKPFPFPDRRTRALSASLRAETLERVDEVTPKLSSAGRHDGDGMIDVELHYGGLVMAVSSLSSMIALLPIPTFRVSS